MKTYYSLTKDPEWDYLIKPAILALAVFAIVLMLMVFAATYPGFLPSVLIFGPEILKVSLTICLFNFSFLGFNIFFRKPVEFFTFSKDGQNEDGENYSDQSENSKLFSLNATRRKLHLIEAEKDSKDSSEKYNHSRIKGPAFYRDVQASTLYGATVDTPTSSFSPLGPN